MADNIENTAEYNRPLGKVGEALAQISAAEMPVHSFKPVTVDMLTWAMRTRPDGMKIVVQEGRLFGIFEGRRYVLWRNYPAWCLEEGNMGKPAFFFSKGEFKRVQ